MVIVVGVFDMFVCLLFMVQYGIDVKLLFVDVLDWFSVICDEDDLEVVYLLYLVFYQYFDYDIGDWFLFVV